ncbi:methyltransferase domain-containing protein [Akkermansia glycaniphila]|nr:methyltransferase domain-containing protein [Akkermansia glycaniphila]
MADGVHGLMRPLVCAHDWVERVLVPGDSAVDATAGNGYDTLFLARLVGPSGHVHAFDVQAAALEETRRRLMREGCGERVSLHGCSHSRMREAVPDGVKAVMFNLGYLPGSDHEVKTVKEETVPAVQAASELLLPGGVLTVMCYPGHEGGREECKAVEEFLESLPLPQWRVVRLSSANGSSDAAFLLAALRVPGK